MTKADLQQQGIAETVNTKGFQAMMIYLMENPPAVDARGRDATAILNDEGFQRGYQHALRELRTIHQMPAPLKREPVQHYQQPTQPESK